MQDAHQLSWIVKSLDMDTIYYMGPDGTTPDSFTSSIFWLLFQLVQKAQNNVWQEGIYHLYNRHDPKHGLQVYVYTQGGYTMY